MRITRLCEKSDYRVWKCIENITKRHVPIKSHCNRICVKHRNMRCEILPKNFIYKEICSTLILQSVLL